MKSKILCIKQRRLVVKLLEELDVADKKQTKDNINYYECTVDKSIFNYVDKSIRHKKDRDFYIENKVYQDLNRNTYEYINPYHERNYNIFGIVNRNIYDTLHDYRGMYVFKGLSDDERYKQRIIRFNNMTNYTKKLENIRDDIRSLIRNKEYLYNQDHLIDYNHHIRNVKGIFDRLMSVGKYSIVTIESTDVDILHYARESLKPLEKKND